jgi:phosphate transport system protein
MTQEHLIKSIDEEFRHLHELIARMGELVETQIGDAILSVTERDSALATEVIANDIEVDKIEQQIEDLTLRMMALRQPVATDLREVLSALRISGDLERIGDYAVNVAKRAIALNQMSRIRPANAMPRMGQIAKQMIRDVLDAYIKRDVDKAIEVWNCDEELDEMYSSLFRVLLTHMMEDPRNITPSTHLLFIAKNIERVGDHATNIAETIYFLVTGTALRAARPKRDETAFLAEPTRDEKRPRA